jgi:hypothetical protein
LHQSEDGVDLAMIETILNTVNNDLRNEVCEKCRENILHFFYKIIFFKSTKQRICKQTNQKSIFFIHHTNQSESFEPNFVGRDVIFHAQMKHG